MSKKLLALIMALAVVFSVMTILASAQTIKAGDVTNDGKVTAADARKALRVAAGLEVFDEIQLLTADITGDGKITAADARKILRAAAGLETLPEITVEDESETEDADLSFDDAIDSVLNSEAFVDSQNLYAEFTDQEPKVPEVVEVLDYKIDDFDGVKMHCMLVHISADVAFWIDKDAEMGAIEDDFYVLIDSETDSVYDSISTNALNCEHDTTTMLGRATYLMWMYDGMVNGSGAEYFVNDSETVVKLTNMSTH